MSLFQVFEAWEFPIEVLSQVQHLLADVKNLVLAHSTHADQSLDDVGVDEVLLLQLLTDLE